MSDRRNKVDLYRAREGDQAALAALIAGFMPKIRRFARAAVCPGLDFEDAVQEGYIGLFDAARSYQEGGQATFETYATVCIRNAIVAARRTARRKKHQALSDALPLDEQISTPGPEEQAILREQINETVYRINNGLTRFERRVLLLFLQGRSYAQIASQLSCPTKSVENALVRVRRKLKKE